MHAYRTGDGSLTELCIALNRVYSWEVLSRASAVCSATATWKSTRALASADAPCAPVVARPKPCRFQIVPVLGLPTFQV